MNRKIEAACYGGKSKAFFKEQNKVFHQFNVMRSTETLQGAIRQVPTAKVRG